MKNIISSNCPETMIAAGYDRVRDRDLNRFLNDDSVGCIWCGDGIAEHSDNLDWIEFVEFEDEYYHSNCFDRFVEQQEEQISKFIQDETEAAAKIADYTDF
jgi:hypothetical protein